MEAVTAELKGLMKRVIELDEWLDKAGRELGLHWRLDDPRVQTWQDG